MRLAKAAIAGGLGLALAGPVRAEIDFVSMPNGCGWTLRYSDGQVQTETFLGVNDGQYKTQVTNGRELVRQTTYDANGRMVRKDWADGNWESFSPYSCFAEVGSCTYRYRNSSGADQTIISTTVASGNGFMVQAGPKGGARYPDEYFEIGIFGLMTLNKALTYSARLIETKNCDPT